MPARFPRNGTAPRCSLRQPPSFPMVDFADTMKIWKTGNVSSGDTMGFDATMGAAWFEFHNETTGERHQVWQEDPRSVHAKSQFAFQSGLGGVAFWRGNEVFGQNRHTDPDGVDSPEARAMWQAASPNGSGYGGRGFHRPKTDDLQTRTGSGPLQLRVAPNGTDSCSPDTGCAFASCAGAIAYMSSIIKRAGLPPGGIEVRIANGRYKYDSSTACTGIDFQGSRQAPIVFRGASQAGVVFDGSKAIDTTQLKPVTNLTMRRILQPHVVDKVLTMALPESLAGQLQWDDTPLTPSVWPDDGRLAYVASVLSPGVVYMPGRTKGPPPHHSRDRPIGANISVNELPGGDWNAEFAAGYTGAKATGYFSNDWFSETHAIARVSRSSTNMSLQFEEPSHYSFKEALDNPALPPGRFTVHGLLSELTAPGEYWFDAGQLYLYPPVDVADTDALAAAELSVWSSGTFINVNSTSFITFRDLTVMGAGSGPVVSLVDCMSCILGGVTIKNAAATAIELSGGHDNLIVGNDVFDVHGHITTSGGSASALEPTNNRIENCHFTQVYLHNTGDRLINIKGVGDRFSRNLGHDAPKHFLTFSGKLLMMISRLNAFAIAAPEASRRRAADDVRPQRVLQHRLRARGRGLDVRWC